MTRLGRVRRRPDHWATPHERARHRSAERLDGPLGVVEAAWLDEHLADCAACLATAQAYETDRAGLRSLRDDNPVPPRDLWARTSAAIEQEAAGHRRASTGSPRRSPLAQWGAIAGIAVVAVVVGSSVLQGGWFDAPKGTTNGDDSSMTAFVTPQPQPTGVEVVPGATPMTVDAGSVGWFDVGADGSYAYNVANVDQVCAQVDQASCAALDAGDARRVALATSPKSIITSSNGQTVVVGADGSDGNTVFVVALPEDPRATPPPTASPTASATPPPTSSPTTAIAPPTASPSADPSPSEVAPPSASPASPPASDVPTPTPTLEVTPSPTPTIDATPTPTMTPAPTAAALAIISGVTVVGDAAAFSPDGEWFAFTARPADGSAGPDIYLWHVGDPHAHAMTTDHQSAFGSWAGGLVVGSRPGLPPAAPAPSSDATAGASSTPDQQPAEDVKPVTFSLDPATGTEVILPVAWWRPAVSPTGRQAVVWDGSVRADSGDRTITPTDGRLVLVDWGVGDTASTDPAPRTVSKDPISDFTVRWDETGSWLAVWLADAGDPKVGRLSLLHLDPTSGKIDRPAAGPQDVPAMPGFSIENGRLAWASPPSQDGEGSHIQIVAWSADGVGSIESAPSQDVVVVR